MTEEQRFRLAAKACGKDLTGWVWDDFTQAFDRYRRPGNGGDLVDHWNPRDDDGDSRRLQVDCQMRVTVNRNYTAVDCDYLKDVNQTKPCCNLFEAKHKDDRHAATRIAVLNCAVAIGEAMK